METMNSRRHRGKDADFRNPRFGLILAGACLLVLTVRVASGATLTEDLDKAIVDGDQKRFELLLAQAPDPNAKTETTTPLIGDAAYFGREKMLESLLAKGADFRVVDGEGWTVLHYAALGGHPAIVARMIRMGLGVNDRIRSDGMTALAMAAVRGHTDVIRLLLAQHADLSIPDFGGNTPLLHAALRGRTEAVRLLIATGADVNLASRPGWTPLMAAAWEGHADIVKLLLKHGAKSQATNAQGQSALSLAESAEHGQIAKLLAKSKPQERL
jgi:ankyrin repeat protein